MKKQSKIFISEYKSNRCSDCGLCSDRHKNTCVFKSGIENVDYIVCSVCGHKGRNITQHLKRIHKLSKDEYQGMVSAPKTFEKKSKSLKGKENWVSFYKRTNPQKAKQMIIQMSKNVSSSVMKNTTERKRRSNTMKKLWREYDDYFRSVASKAAKKTSKRPDILQKRTENLRKWRKNNPEKIRELGKNLSKRNKKWREENPEEVSKAIEKALKYRTTKPEKTLYRHVLSCHPSFNFKFNQMLYDDNFQTKTKKRQLDIVSWDKKIVIEYDGVHHFKEFAHDLSEKKKKDKQLNSVLVNNGYTIIRVAYDQYHKTQGFNEKCLIQINFFIKKHTKNNIRCIRIGKAYEQ